MEHRRNVAGRIWGEARHSPSAPGYRFDLLQNIWDVGSGDPTPPQGVRKKIIAVFFAFWNLKGSRPPKPTPPHAQTLSDWARGKPRCEAVLLNHILNYSLFSHTCCRQVAVPSRDTSGQYHWQEKILFFLIKSRSESLSTTYVVYYEECAWCLGSWISRFHLTPLPFPWNFPLLVWVTSSVVLVLSLCLPFLTSFSSCQHARGVTGTSEEYHWLSPLLLGPQKCTESSCSV